ncbi:transporter substrate-binding domain-containing protein [Desulfuromonas sp. TF]|uniref:transporter substrate-binding domain-containing protein n=1 Tax=Desulfuromonas sp. TF TaxID=1232410 RepID=UPI001D04AA63|nr:transporter substrate-binding domain-containing protein [Desulfuromonas sp. TF]
MTAFRVLMISLAALILCTAPRAGAESYSPAESLPVIVGGDHSYPPYEFLDEEGRPSGFNVELTRAIARIMGMEVDIRLGSWNEMRRALMDGNVDILQGMVPSEERTAQVDFTLPHAVVHQSIWNRKDETPITAVEQMTGRQVIVMRGSIMHDFMLRQNIDARLVTVDSLADALRLLAAGRHDCALVAKLPGQYLIRKLGLTNIQPVPRPLLAQEYGYAVKKGNREMLARFNEGLSILKESGEYQAIYREWLGVLEPQRMPWVRLVRYGAMVVVPLLLVLGGTVTWNRTLKKEVAARTAALESEIAERKRAMDELKVRQRQLIQADKMTSLGILVSGVAHEINNPTGLILLNLPHLQKAWEAAEPILEEHSRKKGDFRLGWLKYSRMRREIPQMFDEMQDGARRIKHIVDDLKDFARRDDADLMTPVHLNTSLAAALRLVDNSIRKATSRFEVAFGENLPRFKGSQQRIEQVIVNLVLNACQALPDTERGIFVRTWHDAGSGQVVLEVKDEGEGIAAEHLPHLTDPFFTTKRDTGGTGLGLSVSAGIVKDHGGSLLFDSPPGAGMTAILRLPAFTEERST